MALLERLFKKKDDASDIPHQGDKGANDEQEQQELLNEEKRDMIRGIEELAETSVKEVMIPRIDVDFLSLTTPEDELISTMSSAYCT